MQSDHDGFVYTKVSVLRSSQRLEVEEGKRGNISIPTFPFLWFYIQYLVLVSSVDKHFLAFSIRNHACHPVYRSHTIIYPDAGVLCKDQVQSLSS